jgi:RNA polymerase sigma-B factor
MASHPTAAGDARATTRETSAALFAALAGDVPDGERTRLRDDLVRLHLPLVEHCARRFQNRGEPLEDLVQVGTIGLIKAVDRYDVSRGVEFTSYGVPTIVGEIRRHIRDKAWAMHVARRIKEVSVRMARVLDDLTTTLGRSPTIAELAAAAGVDEEDVIDALDAAHAYSTRSLDASPGTGDQLAEHLAGPDPGYEGVDDRWLLSAGLDALDPRERRIVHLRFFEEMTQSQIAADLGISQMHVSRLLRNALDVMRGSIEAQGGGDEH